MIEEGLASIVSYCCIEAHNPSAARAAIIRGVVQVVLFKEYGIAAAKPGVAIPRRVSILFAGGSRHGSSLPNQHGMVYHSSDLTADDENSIVYPVCVAVVPTELASSTEVKCAVIGLANTSRETVPASLTSHQGYPSQS
jgi:hypothetical protein